MEFMNKIWIVFSIKAPTQPSQPLWLHWFLQLFQWNYIRKFSLLFFIKYVVFIYYSFDIEVRNKSLSDPFASIEKFFVFLFSVYKYPYN